MFKLLILLFSVFTVSECSDIIINGQKIDSGNANVGAIIDFVNKTKSGGISGLSTSQKAFLPQQKWNMCSSCHGENGNIIPEGSNMKITEFTEEELVKKIKLYRDYNGEASGNIKDFKRAQMMGMSDDDVRKLASFIKTK